ncbi:hypothetical protein WKI13_14090 [Teredinibacter turnerae]|uniref:hypothetical protein n=1 Tax=Teredinibacter turnerae TaxID=2426 RepID=UPI001E39EB85|nr:hypothetical protein [Teredinibacter turnerae]
MRNSGNSHTSPHKTAAMRFVIYHIHPVSARLRILKTTSNQLCFPKQLPPLAELIDQPRAITKVSTHPGAYVLECCNQMDIPENAVAITKHLRLWVDIPGGPVPVYFLQITTPQPFKIGKATEWMEFADCFCLIPLEREILQALYRWLLE